MTILGWVDFRATEHKEQNSEGATDVLLFADGRISVNSGNGKLTDAAPKLQVLDICVIDKLGRVKRSTVSVGFAGASALVAMSAIAFASNVLRQLYGSELPTVSQVSSFVANAFRAALEEYSTNQLKSADAAMILAGFDHSVKKTVVQAMYFRPRVGIYEVEPIFSKSYLTVVTGPNHWDLDKRLDLVLKNHMRQCGWTLIVNTATQIEYGIRAVANTQPFGGQLQLCTVDGRGPRLLPTLMWDFSFKRPDLPSDWSKGDYRITMLGYDLVDLRVGPCNFIAYEPVPIPDVDETPWAKVDIPCD